MLAHSDKYFYSYFAFIMRDQNARCAKQFAASTIELGSPPLSKVDIRFGATYEDLAADFCLTCIKLRVRQIGESRSLKLITPPNKSMDVRAKSDFVFYTGLRVFCAAVSISSVLT